MGFFGGGYFSFRGKRKISPAPPKKKTGIGGG